MCCTHRCEQRAFTLFEQIKFSIFQAIVISAMECFSDLNNTNRQLGIQAS